VTVASNKDDDGTLVDCQYAEKEAVRVAGAGSPAEALGRARWCLRTAKIAPG